MNPIVISIAELRPALLGLSKVMRKRVTLPVLGCVRLQCTNPNTLEMAATDLDVTLAVKLISQPQSCSATVLVPFNELNNITKTCGPDDHIEVIPGSDPKHVTLKCPLGGQWIEHRLDTCPPDEFPALPEFPGNSIPLADAVRENILAALECASTDSTRLILNSVFLDISQAHSHCVIGTDGRQLFAANSFHLPLDESLIIPAHKFLEWKGFTGDGAWALQTQPASAGNPPKLQIVSERWRFIANSIEGPYPNWRFVIPELSSFQTRITIYPGDQEVLAQTIRRLPCHSEVFHTLGLETRRQSLRLLGRSRPEVPWTKVEVPVESISGPDVTIYVDRQRLLRALRFGLNRLEIIDGISALRMTDDQGRQIILMPLRPDEPVVNSDNPPTHSDEPISAESRTRNLCTPNSPENQPMPIYEDHPTVNALAPITAVSEPIRSITVSDSAKENTEIVEKPPLEAALSHIENLKAGFRETINGLSKLSELLKQSAREQKASKRDFESIRQTLRSLQGVRI